MRVLMEVVKKPSITFTFTAEEAAILRMSVQVLSCSCQQDGAEWSGSEAVNGWNCDACGRYIPAEGK